MISAEGLDGKFFSAGLNKLCSAGVWFSVAETARTLFAKHAVASIEGRENSPFFFIPCFNFFQSSQYRELHSWSGRPSPGFFEARGTNKFFGFFFTLFT